MKRIPRLLPILKPFFGAKEKPLKMKKTLFGYCLGVLRKTFSQFTSRSAQHPRSLLMVACLCGALPAGALPVAETVIYSFANTNASVTGGSPRCRLVVGSDGALYGVTDAFGKGSVNAGGTIFKINQDGSGFQVLHTFSDDPDGGMTISDVDVTLTLGTDHFLYGATFLGGDSELGTVYKLAEDGGSYQVLHRFDNSQNDRMPVATLLQASDGWLYGMTTEGVIFKMNTNGGGYTVLTNAIEGTLSGLLEGHDGGIYGTTLESVFKVNKDGSGYTTLHAFNGVDGSNTVGRLIQSTNDFLYGVAREGGSGFGSIFRVDTNGNNFQVVHNFNDGSFPGDGEFPQAGLAAGIGGFFYGTTINGSTNTGGTVFKINQDGSGYELLSAFQQTPATGGAPSAGLVQGPVQGASGAMYGTTYSPLGTTRGAIYALIVSPPVSITPVVGQIGGQTLVSWPSWALNYVVQTTTNLSSPNWTTVTNGVPMASLLVTNSSAQTYYRLVLPQ